MKCCIDCASVSIAGSGTSTLDNLPDMFVGDMTLTGQIGAGECRSTAGYALEYPNPGAANTITPVQSIGFKKPTGGKCFATASTNKPTTAASSKPTTSASSKPTVSAMLSSSATTPTKSNVDHDDNEFDSSLPLVLKFVFESTTYKG